MQQEIKKQILDTFGERIDEIAFLLLQGKFAIGNFTVNRCGFEEEAELELLVNGVHVTMKFERLLSQSY
jgi:hypothetical protein